MVNSVVASYDATSRRAKLSYTGKPQIWPRIRRVCFDTTDQAAEEGPNLLTLPWWAFLSSREDLEYQARRYDFEIVTDESSRPKLEAAEQHKSNYEATLTATPFSEDAIRQRLKDAAWNLTEREPTHEQFRNIGKLAAASAGATFSVPGAGKTTEALALHILRRSTATTLLVIAPKNAFPAWEEQLAICLPKEEGFTRLIGGRRNIAALLKREPKNLLITYEQAAIVIDEIANYVATFDTFLVLDESHRMKRGFEGVIGNAVLSICELPQSKLIMSGTPMPNDISDLVPQFRFLFPEIEADETNVDELIQPVYVRTTKAELGLPDPRRSEVSIPLKPAQYELYRLLSSEAAREANTSIGVSDRIRLRQAGRSALRLLQVATNPALLARVSEFEHSALLADVLEEGDSPKLEFVCLRARQLARQGHKTIIWSSFVNNVELVAERLRDLGAEYIHGRVEAGSEDEEGTREQKIKRFHDDENCMALVANPAACGEGISLHTVCHHAIYLDRNYNAAQYLQSEDRIHRLGLPSDQTTTIEILACPDTVDQSVGRRLKSKIVRMAEVLGDRSLHAEPFSVDLDADVEAFNDEDFADFLKHLDEWRR